MISESKVILLPLKGRYLRVTVPKVSRCGIMATQLLATLTTDHHLLKCGIVVYLVNLWHLFHSIPLDECFISQLERCSYLSLHGLILGCSIFEKIDPSRVFFFPPCHVGRISQSKTTRRWWWTNQRPFEVQLDREDYTSCVSPSPYPTLESRDEILV